MTHGEAETETMEALTSMMETVREQTDHLADLFGIEESKVSTLLKSSTKRTTYAPSESMSQFGGKSMISQ